MGNALQSVKYLVCKNQALSSDPQYSCKKAEHSEYAVHALGRWEQGDPWDWLLSKSASLVRELNSKMKMENG